MDLNAGAEQVGSVRHIRSLDKRHFVAMMDIAEILLLIVA
jgi:hypothetical protein